jgi:hypothetical protein
MFSYNLTRVYDSKISNSLKRLNLPALRKINPIQKRVYEQLNPAISLNVLTIKPTQPTSVERVVA